ncbi:hypothetical protein J4403_00400 [Candidatus Woesearchaeota archaeon]|nr:hypothetical protein [Candidatus Woesearchaeota archaeon]
MNISNKKGLYPKDSGDLVFASILLIFGAVLVFVLSSTDITKTIESPIATFQEYRGLTELNFQVSPDLEPRIALLNFLRTPVESKSIADLIIENNKDNSKIIRENGKFALNSISAGNAGIYILGDLVASKGPIKYDSELTYYLPGNKGLIPIILKWGEDPGKQDFILMEMARI